MEHKSWRSSIPIVLIFCELIMKAKLEPIVYKSLGDSEIILRVVTSVPQQMKRNVHEGEQQWLTRSQAVSSSTTISEATTNTTSASESAPVDDINVVTLVLLKPPNPERTTEDIKEAFAVEKTEEKQANPVTETTTELPIEPPMKLSSEATTTAVPSTTTTPAPKVLQQLGQMCDPSGEKSECSPENSSCMRPGGSDHFICDCNESYEADSSGFCVRSEGSPCNYRRNECSQSSTHLACINSRCVCEKSDIYNSFTKKCESKVGGTCFGGKECMANAYCSKLSYSDFSVSPVGVCECKKGFVESENAVCLRAFGRTCSRNEECDHLNLVCREGLCNCKDSLQRYDFKSQSCLSLVGAECSEGDKSCVEGAYCKVTNRKLYGRCVCATHLMPSEYRTCVSVSAWRSAGGYNKY